MADAADILELAEWEARARRRSDLPDLLPAWPTELPPFDPATLDRFDVAEWEKRVAAAVDPRAVTLIGGDISHHQGDIDIGRLGISYLWAKATEVGFVDGKFSRNRALAARALTPFGAYSFLHPGQNVRAVVAHWFLVAGPLRPGDLRPALDIEVPGFTAAEVKAYIDEVERVFGCKPIVYIATAIWRQPGMAAACAGCELWIPRYGGLPAVPGWTVHQFTDAMRTPAGAIDGNHTTRLDLCLVPGSAQPTPNPTPIPPVEDDMFSDEDRQQLQATEVIVKDVADRLDRLERRLLRQVADENGVVYLTDGLTRVWVPDEAWRGQLADAFSFAAPEKWARAGINKIPLVGPEAPGVTPA